MSIYSTFWSQHYVGHARKPYGGRQNHESASIMSKIISTYSLLLHKWGPSWIVPPFKKHQMANTFFWKPKIYVGPTKYCLLGYQKLPYYGLGYYCMFTSCVFNVWSQYDELSSAIGFWYHLPDTYLFCVIHKWIFCVVVYFKQVFNIW